MSEFLYIHWRILKGLHLEEGIYLLVDLHNIVGTCEDQFRKLLHSSIGK